MSTETLVAADICCASCGIAEVDDIKLMDCDDCDLVRYCSDECKANHLPNHEEMCKERAAELRDEKLFKQPESSHLGDCPICCLPLSLNIKESSLYSCCSKWICNGCVYAHHTRQFNRQINNTCPFCRCPTTTTTEGDHLHFKKRAAANDPVAIHKMGMKHYEEEDYDTAFEYCTKAAKMGDVDAHNSLSIWYREGKGVEKDEKKEVYHLEQAAIGGHPTARWNLACHEGINDIDRAVKHWIIGANLGCDRSIQMLKEFYPGSLSKEDFAAALRAHYAAVNATKSPHREEAARFDATGEL